MTSGVTDHPSDADTSSPFNPYIGPRAFSRGMELPGRDRECRELAQLLVAERIVLLHAPSGAGKSSLLQAGMTEAMKDRGFVTTPALRVNLPVNQKDPPHNRYVHSLAVALLGKRKDIDAAALRSMTLAEVAAEALPRERGKPRPVLVLDQFEEVLNLDPTDQRGQESFFRELGAVLDDGRIWALLSMREDYMGGLHRFARLLPGALQTRYRLDFLTREAARQAIVKPALRQHVRFQRGADDALIDRLMQVRVQTPVGGTQVLKAPYVEPVLLQVVCRRLWQQVRSDRGDNFPVFKVKDVERHADVDTAMRDFYDGGLKRTEQTKDNERIVRDWFETSLITEKLFRSQTPRLPALKGVDPADVVNKLEEAYLIRGVDRAGTVWYELQHDRLIDPVVLSNLVWRQENVAAWRNRAQSYRKTRDSLLLLDKDELPQAQEELAADSSEVEIAFVEASMKRLRDDYMMRWYRRVAGGWGVIAVVEFVIIIVLLVLHLTR